MFPQLLGIILLLLLRSGLAVENNCGELHCEDSQYCDLHSGQCMPCVDLCKTHQKDCVEKCGAYLYREHRKMEEVARNLTSRISKLDVNLQSRLNTVDYRLQRADIFLVVILAISCFFVLALFFYVIIAVGWKSYRRNQLKRKKKKQESQLTSVIYQNDHARIRGIPHTAPPSVHEETRDWRRSEPATLNSFYKPQTEEPIMKPLARRQPSEHSLNYFRGSGVYENTDATEWPE